MSDPITLRTFQIAATVIDLIPKQLHPLAHVKLVARGMAALSDRDPGPGELTEQPERLVTSRVVSYGEGRDEASPEGVKLHELPPRVVVTLAVPADWTVD